MADFLKAIGSVFASRGELRKHRRSREGSLNSIASSVTADEPSSRPATPLRKILSGEENHPYIKSLYKEALACFERSPKHFSIVGLPKRPSTNLELFFFRILFFPHMSLSEIQEKFAATGALDDINDETIAKVLTPYIPGETELNESRAYATKEEVDTVIEKYEEDVTSPIFGDSYRFISSFIKYIQYGLPYLYWNDLKTNHTCNQLRFLDNPPGKCIAISSTEQEVPDASKYLKFILTKRILYTEGMHKENTQTFIDLTPEVLEHPGFQALIPFFDEVKSSPELYRILKPKIRPASPMSRFGGGRRQQRRRTQKDVRRTRRRRGRRGTLGQR